MKLIVLLLFVFVSIRVSISRGEGIAVYNSEQDRQAVLTFSETVASRAGLPPGFRADVFAAEPAVQNPVGMAWDARGRVWVAENYTYAERSMRFDLRLFDRVVILEDQDGDGKSDKRTIFTDKVQMLTSVEIGRGGVWLMCPPQLLFVPDRNQDDQPDGEPEVVLDGFTVARDNYHNFANGLKWGPDGWLYGRTGHACPGKIGVPGTPVSERVPLHGGIWRFHPVRKTFEVLSHGTTNPWGHDWNEHGEGFFINTVNGHLWHLIPGAHFMRSSSLDPNPHVYHPIDTHADHWHFDTGKGWTSSRDGKANDFGGGHAHSGMMIYQGDQWPAEWRGRLLTLNLHGRRVNVERLEKQGGGYTGRHQGDAFFFNDPWFRGIELSTDPDGAGYILDWSDVGECHESTEVHRTSGRVYKISYGQPSTSRRKLDQIIPSPIEALRHPNDWFARKSREQIATAAGFAGAETAETADALWKIVTDETNTVFRLRALWALNAVGTVAGDRLRPLLKDGHPHLRS